MFDSQPVCGGTNKSWDSDAPKEIVSADLVYFSADTSLNTFSVHGAYDYIFAYAVKTENGNLLYFNGRQDPYCKQAGILTGFAAAFVTYDIFPELDGIAKKHNFVCGNGSHSQTAGLPQNFGGAMYLKYASGEYISKSSNQSPVFGPDAADETGRLYGKVLASGTDAELPSFGDAVRIQFREDRTDGGYSDRILTKDGTGWTLKTADYYEFNGGSMFEHEYTVAPEQLDGLRKLTEDYKVFAWQYLDEDPNAFTSISVNRLSFAFADGSTVDIKDTVKLPVQLGMFSFYPFKNAIDSLTKKEQ